jgi:hypothetical protein
VVVAELRSTRPAVPVVFGSGRPFFAIGDMDEPLRLDIHDHAGRHVAHWYDVSR